MVVGRGTGNTLRPSPSVLTQEAWLLQSLVYPLRWQGGHGPFSHVEMNYRDAALLVTPRWEIGMARRLTALLVTSKRDINVARRRASL